MYLVLNCTDLYNRNRKRMKKKKIRTIADAERQECSRFVSSIELVLPGTIVKPPDTRDNDSFYSVQMPWNSPHGNDQLSVHLICCPIGMQFFHAPLQQAPIPAVALMI